ncbi:MAG TPA: hypothetical protein VF544_18100 [Pyrinomonadaceae bacterium]|jgi:hypothetical protein
MAELIAYPNASSDAGDETRMRPDRRSTNNTPGRVIVFGIIVTVLILLFGHLHLMGNGFGVYPLPIEQGAQQP